MKNYKIIRWIEELQEQREQKSQGLGIPSLKEIKIADHSHHEISKILY
ncbi:hypothetical protein LF887_15240 [Chryseobacterium sp. MEBOG06]|nr:hypothetical protein [Chryseobacterium sp. MEBOG06]UKB82358.1 hypothetical protein LF887_15240 [Chryseobacterium sp. MEBOG06]